MQELDRLKQNLKEEDQLDPLALKVLNEIKQDNPHLRPWDPTQLAKDPGLNLKTIDEELKSVKLK